MKNICTLVTLAALLMGCNDGVKSGQTAAATADTSQPAEPATTTHAAMPDSATMARAWQNYMTPGDMHKWMASSAGKWDAEIVFWMNPGAAPTPPSKATMESRMVLNGLYQESIYRGNMGGMNFEGRGLMAYDNARKKFIDTWVDNMGSGVMYQEGTYDEGSRSLTLTGKTTDPVTGGEKQIRQVMKMTDDKHQVLEMYDSQDGKEYKSMEIHLSKR
jgi:hypothetical protein